MVTLVTVTIFRSKPINIVQNRARSACAWSFMYGSDELWDLFNPILNLQVWDTIEVVCIAGDENKVFFQRCGCNKHVHVSNLHSLLLQHPTQFAIFAEMLNRIRLKKTIYLSYIVKVLLSARLVCTEI